MLRADLVRDISYDKNGQKRPTQFLFSADTADPYEIGPIKHLIANLTCNPGIIYDDSVTVLARFFTLKDKTGSVTKWKKRQYPNRLNGSFRTLTLHCNLEEFNMEDHNDLKAKRIFS